nr:unnamed protein product [Callosobruchus analis]
MSKRSYNSDLEKEDHVIKRQRKKEKFDKLQREMETLQRKIDLFSSDSSSAEEGDGIRTTTIADVHVEADSLNLVINENEPIIKPALSEITDTLNIGAETTSEEPRDGPTDILRLFGSDPASSNPQGVILFDWMASRLENIVKSGINHEEKQKIIEKYPPAANCTLLVPPILNEEIAVLLTQSTVTLPWLWHIYQDGFSKEKHTRGSHTHTFSFSVGEDYETI